MLTNWVDVIKVRQQLAEAAALHSDDDEEEEEEEETDDDEEEEAQGKRDFCVVLRMPG